MDTKGGKRQGGGGGGVMNWAIGIDMYTLMCIKWMTNKDLLYKKINKIKFQKEKRKKKSDNSERHFRQFVSNPHLFYSEQVHGNCG